MLPFRIRNVPCGEAHYPDSRLSPLQNRSLQEFKTTVFNSFSDTPHPPHPTHTANRTRNAIQPTQLPDSHWIKQFEVGKSKTNKSPHCCGFGDGYMWCQYSLFGNSSAFELAELPAASLQLLVVICWDWCLHTRLMIPGFWYAVYQSYGANKYPKCRECCPSEQRPHPSDGTTWIATSVILTTIWRLQACGINIRVSGTSTPPLSSGHMAFHSPTVITLKKNWLSPPRPDRR